LFKHIGRLFDERENDELTQSLLFTELQQLLEDNSSLAFCKQMKEYEKLSIETEDFLLLFLFCHRFVNLDDDMVGFHDFEDIYERKSSFQYIKSKLRGGSHSLMENSILEYSNDSGFSDREYYRIASAAKEKLFAELEIKTHQAQNKKGLILCKDITPKPLFYNEREKSQIEQLASLLSTENFTSVQKQLEQNGMRKGFAALFYGAPGTGKTETVYQIAHQTGRDIMMVDISNTKSCWFGESEKKIKEVFEKYSAFVKNCEIAPILLFNEADAVIGKRKDTTSGSVAQTENAIQNIILQEMENLSGILIATTNLTQNLDKAFERRFLYKIEFDKPGNEAKEKIWQAMLPALTQEESKTLATHYNFSGGQIENIVRKYTIDSIINGITPSFETVKSYCKTEFLYKEDTTKRIGFRREEEE
jgi:SpoVK/Ycf46/Vps4 family AAA+-type ATPase